MARVLSNILYTLAIVTIIISFFINNLTVYRNIAIFTLVGAFTNDIAIFMIFTKIPFLYGSGIIEIKFENIKKSIKKIVLDEFFNSNQIEKFKSNLTGEKSIINSEAIYTMIKEAIMSSKFASMLSMMGGEKLIDSQKNIFIDRIDEQITKITKDPKLDISNNIEKLITERINELTPKMVKAIIRNIIKEHLSWLVLWGGIIGCIVGIVSVNI